MLACPLFTFSLVEVLKVSDSLLVMNKLRRKASVKLCNFDHRVIQKLFSILRASHSVHFAKTMLLDTEEIYTSEF